MDDLANRRRLERDADDLLKSSNPEVVAFGQQAHDAIKKMKWGDADQFVRKGQALNKPLTLLEFLATTGGVASKAAARRLVDAGGVLVDEKRAKSVDVDISGATSIKVNGVEKL